MEPTEDVFALIGSTSSLLGGSIELRTPPAAKRNAARYFHIMRIGFRAVAAGLVLGFVQFLSGCALIDDCTYEERSITGFNAVIENGEEIVRAEIVVAESSGSIALKSVNPAIRGTLKGHVTSILLFNSANPSAQFAIPLDPPSSSVIASGILIQRPGDTSPDLAGVYEIVASSSAVLQITTDLPSRPSLTIPLTVTQRQDWFRPQNCY